MNLQPPINPNYCATVVTLHHFSDLAGCDNLKAALIFGNRVIVGKDRKEGDKGLFFPIETQLSEEFLRANNLYRNPDLNSDKSIKGYFDTNGRVRAVKLRGHASEGLWLPLESLDYLKLGQVTWIDGDEFDQIGDHKVCQKYYVPVKVAITSKSQPKKIHISPHFRFHYDTEHLGRNMDQIFPDTLLSISDKWHGTSAVYARVLSDRPLNWLERLAKRFGIPVVERQYTFIWSSRTVVKGVDDTPKEDKQHFYGEDVWGVVGNAVREKLPEGFTVYGEIVGYTPGGSPIQKTGSGVYAYGCERGQHKFVVYRVTYTAPNGIVIELPWSSMLEFCAFFQFDTVPTIFHGKASQLCPQFIPERPLTLDEWRDKFFNTVKEEFVENKYCQYNAYRIPAEGVVVRIDGLCVSRAFKLKSFLFLEGETKALDKGEVDMETLES